MRHLRRSAFLKLVVLPFALTLFVSACHKWVPLEPPVSQALAVESPTLLPNPTRITLNDGQRITLEDATLSADSVVGTRERRSEASPIRRVRIALEDVSDVERKKAKVGESVLLGVGVITVIGVVTLALMIGFSVLR